MVTASVNPLSPKSDQHQISLCNINVLLNRAVVRITDTITQNEFAWYFINFSTTSVGNEQGRQKRIHILILGFKGLRDLWLLMFYLLDFSSIHGGTPASYSFLFGRFIVPAIKEIKFVLQRSRKRKKGKWRNVWQIEGNVSSFGLERLTPASKSIFFFSVFCRNKITYLCWLVLLFSLLWELALTVKKNEIYSEAWNLSQQQLPLC